MKNTAHSFTEADDCTDVETMKSKLHDNNTLDALHTLVALHNREKEGDETITMKEWNAAIKSANEVIRNEFNP